MVFIGDYSDGESDGDGDRDGDGEALGIPVPRKEKNRMKKVFEYIEEDDPATVIAATSRRRRTAEHLEEEAIDTVLKETIFGRPGISTDVLYTAAQIFMGETFLPYHEFIRFGAVCKDFGEAIRVIGKPNGYNGSSWIVTCWYLKKEVELDLSDLLVKRTFGVGSMIRAADHDLLTAGNVLASRFGWLLLSKKREVLPETEDDLFCVQVGADLLFYFYSPFRNKFIHIKAPFKLHKEGLDHLATFTSTPTAPHECKVFVLENTSELCIVSMYDLKKLEWTSICERRIGHLVMSVVYVEEQLLCTLSVQHGSCSLGCFNILTKEWKTVRLLGDVDGDTQPPNTFTHFPFLVEDEREREIYVLVREVPNRWHGFHFQYRKKWVKVQNLKEVFDKKLFFLACPSCIAVDHEPADTESCVGEEQWHPLTVYGSAGLLRFIETFEFFDGTVRRRGHCYARAQRKGVLKAALLQTPDDVGDA